MSTAVQSRRARGQAGFTLMEVLIAIVLFAISVVGLVAMDARSAEAQRAASLLRDGERIAQEEMAELAAAGFVELLSVDFAGNAGPGLPYVDTPATAPIRDFRRPPADLPNSTNVPGSIRGSFMVVRSVDWVYDIANAPANPPDLATELSRINALVLDVTVMWIDDSNPAFPPPASLTTSGLTPSMVDSASVDFAPYVGSVKLRTVRANDAVVVTP